MPRVVSFVLLGLGVFAIAFGVLLRAWAFPDLAKAPVDINSTSVAQGQNVTALVIYKDASGFPDPKIKTGLNLTSVSHVTADLTAPEVKPNGDVAVWIKTSKVTDDATGTLLTASVRSQCLDRHSGESIAPCSKQYLDSSADGKKETVADNQVQQPGLSFKFPFETEKRDYTMYDAAVRSAPVAKFEGEETLKGVDVYRFVQNVAPTKIGERTVPGTLIGKSGSVTADLYYQVKRTLLVEPITGVIILGKEEIKQELRTSGESAGQGTLVFDGTLQFTDKQVDSNIAEADKNQGKLWPLTDLPTILWIVGGLLVLVAGALLVLGGQSTGKRSLVKPTRKQSVGTGS